MFVFPVASHHWWVWEPLENVWGSPGSGAVAKLTCKGFGRCGLRVACWCSSAGLLAESGPGQGYIQLLVVLDQGRVAIVEDQVSQRGVQVVGLGKAVPRGRPVDHAVLHIPVHTALQGRSRV